MTVLLLVVALGACGGSDEGTSSSSTVGIGEALGVFDDGHDFWGPQWGDVLAHDRRGLDELATRLRDHPEVVDELDATDPRDSFVTGVTYDACAPPTLTWQLDGDVLRAAVAEPDEVHDCVEAAPVVALHRFDRDDVAPGTSVTVDRSTGDTTDIVILGTVDEPPTGPGPDDDAAARVRSRHVATLTSSAEIPRPDDLATVISGNDQRAASRSTELADLVRTSAGPSAVEALEDADLDEVLVVAHGFDACTIIGVTWQLERDVDGTVLAPVFEEEDIACEAPVPVLDIELFEWAALGVEPGHALDVRVSSRSTVTTARPIGELVGVIPDEAEPWATTPSMVADDADGLERLGERVGEHPMAADVLATEPAASIVVAVAHDECSQPSLRWTIDDAALTVTVVDPASPVVCVRAQQGLAVYRFERPPLDGLEIRQVGPDGQVTVLAERIDP